MTEDDTFNKLKRTPFNELVSRRWSEYFSSTIDAVPEEFFTKHGWTKEEYFNDDDRG